METQQMMIEKKVFSFIEENQMILPGEHIVAGVSGGADSVCLFFLLLEYAKKIPFSLYVVHVNHGIRKDAGEDAAYVKQLCEENKVPFFLREADVRSYAAQNKCSDEDAGRRIRYETFERVLNQQGSGKIAVAHNSNDRAETLLFHLFRGSGLKGLCGIRPKRDRIIRPLLCLEREEIEAYLRAREITWRTDSTNGTDDYARNRIRHHILPFVEEQLVHGCVGHIARTADILTETEDYLYQQTLLAKESCVAVRKDGYEISAAAFQKLHPAIGKRLIHLLAEEVSPTGKDISRIHVEEVRRLLQEPGNRSLHLPMGIFVQRSYETVILQRKPEETGQQLSYDIPLSALSEEKELFFKLGKQGSLGLKLISGGQNKEVPINQCTKWFDYDRIEKSLSIRNRNTGDFLSISNGQGQIKHKSLKDYMITEKIPRQDRDRRYLLTEEHHVLWLLGGRISEYYKVNQQTNRILQVRFKENCMDSETEEENGRTC